jgi:hypothetical protein
MDRLVVKDLKPRERNRRAKGAKLVSKRVRGLDGTAETVYVLDTDSPTFEDQFLKVFQLNVTRARREAARRRRAIAAE